jgi:pyruvate dehydrogenase E2 component (dihydrolipoamide acetyltransferase)
MPFTLTMPKLSPTMDGGTIVKWHKKAGDQVLAGDILFEVATDKATVEHTSLDEGWIRQILVQEGNEAIVNQAIAIMTETKDENIAGYVPEKIAEKIVMESSIATETVPSSYVKGPASLTTTFQQPQFIPEPPLENELFHASSSELRASPLAKRLASEKGVDLREIKGTGPQGRIMSRDLEKAPEAFKFGTITEAKRSIPPGTYTEHSLSPMRKAIGQRLQESKTFIPHFYVSQEINPEPLLLVREQLKNYNIKLTINDFFVRACALALREHAGINCGFNSVTQSIIQFETIDIAIAVNIDQGLITPIVRRADNKGIREISAEIRSLAQRARDGKLKPTEYKGGSFTISNLGMYGVSSFQAIINPPQAAILAISGIEEVPVVKNNQLVPGKKMTLTLSVDHRVIDGAAAALFLNELKKIIENPSVLLIS